MREADVMFEYKKGFEEQHPSVSVKTSAFVFALLFARISVLFHRTLLTLLAGLRQGGEGPGGVMKTIGGGGGVKPDVSVESKDMGIRSTVVIPLICIKPCTREFGKTGSQKAFVSTKALL